MAKKIKVNIAGAAFTGKIVTFKAPCDCTEATGLVIGEDTYDVVDALGNCITGSYLAWRGGALVSVALDVDSKKAFIQNKAAPVVTNPNLLHNWYFANPVNQRGQTEYTGYVYTIDRWFKHENGSVFVNADSVSVNGVLFRQFIENGINTICGKNCCFSVLTKDGELLTGFGTVSSNGSREFYRANDVLLYAYADEISVSVVIETLNGKALQLVAAKLEFGSTQTLAHQDENGNWVLNEIPDYAEELAKCQRYFLRLGSSNYGQIGMGMVHSDNILGVWLNPPTVMRIRPTPTLTGKIVAVDSTTGTPYEVQLNDGNSINKYTLPETGVVVLYLTGKTTALTPGKVYSVQAQGGGYVDLSADL